MVVIAFGSNLGPRERHILAAADQVARFLTDFRLSPLIETVPVGAGTEADPPYLNAVGVGESGLAPREILARLHAIEDAAGRWRGRPNAPRTLDLDLILAGRAVIEGDDIRVPHPRFRERLFVLEPLAGLAPDLVDPVTGRTVREILARLDS